MKKVLITGAGGFVGSYLVPYLKQDPQLKVFELTRKEADITDFNKLKDYVREVFPDQVYHLAGISLGSYRDEEIVNKTNVEGTVNLLNALTLADKKTRVLIISSTYVYGNTIECATEEAPLYKVGAYGTSKILMEEEVRKFMGGNLEVVVARSSNHTGPGQRTGFVVSDFALQIFQAKENSVILTGNLEAQRDFLDVRDVVKAYKILMEQGVPGETYNVSSGKPILIRVILEKLIEISKKNLSFQVDPSKLRPLDVPKNCANPEKIMKLGWARKIPLEETLKDVMTCIKQQSIERGNI